MSAVDRTYNSLARDANEISEALDMFCATRKSATDRNMDAYLAYEYDMAEIDNELNGLVENENRPRSPVVDHIILRHINAYASSPLPFENNEYDDELANESDTKSVAESIYLSDEATSKMKKEPLNPTQKLALREEILSFLEMSRGEEINLELQLESGLGNENVNASKLADKLYDAQIKNFAFLLNYMDEYKPTPFTKAWGNDADYKKLTAKLEKEFGINQAGKLGDGSPKKKKSKGKKKNLL